MGGDQNALFFKARATGGNRPPTAQPNALAQQSQMEFVQQFKLPQEVTLSVVFFRTDFSWDTLSSDPSAKLLDKSISVLRKRNFKIDVLEHKTKLIFPRAAADAADLGKLRELAHSSLPGPLPRLPIIFAPLSNGVDSRGIEKDGVPHGVTASGQVGAFNWLPFVVINTRSLSDSLRTIHHEMGHSVKLDHEVSNASEGNFMYEYTKKREQDEMTCCQVAALANAYYAKPQFALTDDFKKRCPRNGSCAKAFAAKV